MNNANRRVLGQPSKSKPDMRNTSSIGAVLFLAALSLVSAGCEPTRDAAFDPATGIGKNPTTTNDGESPTTGITRDAPIEPSVTALVGATLIDGTGADPIADAVVLIDGTEIAAVGPRGAFAIPEGGRTIDTTGQWLVPGLIDAHVHFMESGRLYTKPGQLDLTHLVSYEEEVAWMQQRVPVTLRSYLCAGVTGAISVGGPKFEYEVREQARAQVDAPDIYVGHGPVTLVPADVLFPPFDGDVSVRTVTDAVSATQTIRQGAKWGADLIKSGYLGGPFADAEKDYAAVHEAIIAEAAAQGFKVTTHVTELEPARVLVGLGVDSLQHLPLDATLDAAFLELAVEQDVVVLPTLAVWRRNFIDLYNDRSFDLLEIERQCGDPQVIDSWYEVEELPEAPPAILEAYQGSMDVAMRNTALLLNAGVRLAAGSDSGNLGLLHGPSLHYELHLLEEAGVPPAKLIAAATLNAAEVAGRADRVGSIEVGKQADILVLDADPLADIGNLQAIDQIIKSGVVFDQATLLPAAE